jgi:hypothetical protein
LGVLVTQRIFLTMDILFRRKLRSVGFRVGSCLVKLWRNSIFLVLFVLLFFSLGFLEEKFAGK